MADDNQVQAVPAAPAVPAAGESNNQNDAAQPAQQQQPGMWTVMKSTMTRMFFFYAAMQAMNYFKQQPAATNTVTTTNKIDPKTGVALPNRMVQVPAGNMFAKGSRFDMDVFINEFEQMFSPDSSSFAYKTAKQHAVEDEEMKRQQRQELQPVWSVRNIEYGDWSSGPAMDGVMEHAGQLVLTPSMQNNGSIYLHVRFTESDNFDEQDKTETMADFAEQSPASQEVTRKSAGKKRRSFHSTKQLNKFSKKVYKTTKNLLTGSTDHDEEYQMKAKENVVEILSHWHPNVTINLVDDQTPWQQGQIPAPLNEHFEFDSATGKYYPIVFLNNYWNLHEDYMPINDTLSAVNVTITFSHLALWKWQMYLSQTMKNSWYGNMMQNEDTNDEDQDTIKRTLLETNIYLLALTVIITLVHNVFEFLAFKNDIQFWRNRKTLEGLSVNSVLFGCFQSLIVLLYVCDNDTNTMVKFSVGIGLLIDLWKVPKVLNITLDWGENAYVPGVIPRVAWLHKESYLKTNTNSYDKQAFKYLSWACIPLVLAYSVYSLIYNEHKGWYSWVLSMIYGFLLTFGFIMMTPQLFINYKLKSVAHLPWRMMTYKALNTFIDDIFAFVIKMPTLYRIGCFRDDIIFFIYLYQKWIYPVDKKRTNEFGTSGEDPDGVVLLSAEGEEQRQIEPKTATPDTNTHLKSE